METLRKHLLAISLLVCSLLFFTNNAKASHVAGGYIQLICTGTPGVYTIRLVLYRDCSGISMSTYNQSIHLTSSCGGNIYANASYQNSFEVSQVCAADQNNTTCHGGSVPGYQQYVFEATVNLSACDHWTANYTLCCRNNPTNIVNGSSTNFDISSEFYTATDNCNTSPEVTTQPEPYVCKGQPVSYNLGANEPDGDSIVYTLTAPQDNNGYQSPYSAGDPIGGANLDPNSGTVTFVPGSTGKYIFVITMTEYNSNGDVVTVTHYEYQTTVINCANQTPEPPDANGGQGVSGITGSIIKNSPTSLTLCKGNSGCFDVVFTDPDAGQNITVSSNITSILPGAIVTQTGTNPLTVHVCYTPTGTSGIKTLNFLVEDDACPLTGQNNFGMTINIVDPGTANATTTTEQCGGTDEGTATVSVTGATGPYTYSITGPTNNTSSQTTNTSHQFTNLPPGNYDYSVSTPGGCTLTGSFTIVPGPDLQANITGDDLSCNGAGDGSATVTPTSGSAPYNYVWSQAGTPIGQTTATASNLTAGTYDVLATDKFGCTITKSIVVTEPDLLNGTITPTDVLCNGDASGSVVVSGVTGGTTDYSYSLNGGTYQSSGTFNNLDAGTYQVDIKDANGCQITLNTTLNEPPVLNLSLVNTSNATCGSNTGSLEVSASGGKPNYTYSIGGTPQASGLFTGVGAGSHTVTVTDDNGCTTDLSVNIGSVNSPTATIDNLQNISCFGGNNGQVIIGSTNAPAPVSYSLDGGTGQPSNQFTNVTPGNHTVILTDGNGCTASVDFTISQPTVLTFSSIVTDASCSGVCDGEIAVSPSGGQGPYHYSSDGGLTYGSNATLSNLCAGSVNVYIKDDNGCLYNNSITINQPTGLSANFVLTDPTCRDGDDGQIEANPVGGSPIYQYSVDGGSLQGSNVLTGLTAGNHTVTITDDHGCSVDSVQLLNNPPGINIDTLAMHPSNCHASNGDISFTANGPNPIVNYTLDDGVNTPQTNTTGAFTGLMAGAYKVYVTDSKGCMDSTFYGINDVEMDGSLLDTGSISCYGGNDGWISIENTYGKGANPIRFELDNSGSAIIGNPYTASDPYSNYHYQFNNIAEGNHIITIYDNGNCIYTIPFYLGQPDSISFSQTVTGVSCNGGADGIIDVVNVTGGTGGYQYGEGGGFFVTYQPGNEFTGLSMGTYTITVKDDNGCTQAHNITVDQAPPITFASNIVDLTCHNDNTGAIQIIANGGTGTYQYSNDGGTTFQSLNSFGGLAAGNYDLVVKDQNGCLHDSTVTISQPDTIQATYTPISTLCNGSCDGKIAIVASGGVPIYFYSQDNGITMTSHDTIDGLCAGAYQVYVQDDHGCSITATQTVNEPTAVTLAADSVPSTCSDPNGEIHITAAGGTPTYTYSIDGGTMYAPTGDFTGLAATNYNLAVKDDHGCVVTGAIEITDMPSPQIDMLHGTDPLCFGDANGEIEVTATGGTGVLQYSVDGGTAQSSNILTGLLTGPHTVTISDQNGCTDTKSITLNEPAELLSNSTLTDLTCYQNSTGKIIVVAQGGTPSYQYSFDNGTTFGPSPIDNFIPAGTYAIVVKDNNGCTVNETVTVAEPSQLDFNSIVITNTLCKSATDGETQASALGGTTPYTYQWNDPSNQTTATASNLGAGNYTIVITDFKGCTIDSTVTVTEPDSVEVTAIDITNVTCNGDADGGLVIHSPTGSQFSIDGGTTFQSNNTFTGLLAGTYNIQVQDANGCIVNRSATVFQADPVTLSISNDTTVCYGYNTKVYGSTGGGIQPYTFQWTNGSSTTDTLNVIATSTTTYSLQIFDYNGCPSSIESATITVLPQVSITVQKDTTICPGGTAVLTATGADGLPGYSYAWDNGDTTATISVSPDSMTTYTATVTDKCAQSDAASAVVSIHDLPMPTLVADDTAGCTPLTVNFTNTTDPGSVGGNCVWTIDGQTFNGCSGVPYTFTNPGCYDVSLQVTSPDGCVNDTTYSDYICIDDYPVADFTFSPQKPTILQNQINFENGSVGADSYYWTFQGEGSSTDENPLVTFGHAKEDSKINVCLIASTKLGCTDTICHDVNFTSEFNVYVPNTFTPDADQYNPVFLPIFPPDVNIDKYHLTIFDRWGEILFESYNYQVGWNGTYGGKVVKDGVYIWKIRVKEEGSNKKTREYVGHVTLLK